MTRTKPTKCQLNQAVRSDVPGGDYLLDLFNYLRRVQKYDHTDECKNFLQFIENRMISIRARMRESILARLAGQSPIDPIPACDAIIDEVVASLRARLKNPRVCKRKKLKHDHIQYAKAFRDALVGLKEVMHGRPLPPDKFQR